MAVTAEKSIQVTNMEANPPVKLETNERHGRTRIAYFSHTQGAAAGDIGSTVDLCKLPAGKVRVLKTESYIVCSTFGAARVLDIGHTGYTQPDGTVVAASADTIADGIDVSAAASKQMGAGTNALGTDPTVVYESKAGLTIQAVVAGGTWPVAATLKGYIEYVLD